MFFSAKIDIVLRICRRDLRGSDFSLAHNSKNSFEFKNIFLVGDILAGMSKELDEKRS